MVLDKEYDKQVDMDVDDEMIKEVVGWYLHQRESQQSSFDLTIQ